MQDQSIYEKLREYAKSDAYPFHMPGHKRKVDWISDVYDIDITEIDGFDDLHHADGILEEGMGKRLLRYTVIFGITACTKQKA